MHSGRFGFTADAADTVPGSVQTGSLCSVGAAKLAVREFGRVGLQLAALFATPQQNAIAAAAAAAEPTSRLVYVGIAGARVLWLLQDCHS